jgi:hypothetical protein
MVEGDFGSFEAVLSEKTSKFIVDFRFKLDRYGF